MNQSSKMLNGPGIRTKRAIIIFGQILANQAIVSSSLDLEEMPVERLEGWGVVRRLRWKNR